MFREDALAALHRQEYTSIQVFHGWRDWVATGVALALAAALLLFCALGQVTRKAGVAGVVAHASGTVTIRARESGQLLERHFSEGDHVKAGELLLVISTERVAVNEQGELVATGDRTSSSINTRADRLDSERRARIRYYEARVRAAIDRATLLDEQIRHADAEVESLRERAELAKTAAARYSALAANGFIAAAQLQSRQQEALDATSRMEAARRTALALTSDRAAARTEEQTLREQMKGEIAELERSIESNKQEALQNATRRRLAIVAPADGVVSAMQLAAGQAIQEGQFLLDFLPDTNGAQETAQVQLFASSRTIGFVKPGQQVNLRFDAFPFQKFGMFKGTVSSVSHTPFPAAEIPAGALAALPLQAAAREPMYRILVNMDLAHTRVRQMPPQLKPGMVVAADVLLETRAIWEWALEPLIALQKKL